MKLIKLSFAVSVSHDVKDTYAFRDYLTDAFEVVEINDLPYPDLYDLDIGEKEDEHKYNVDVLLSTDIPLEQVLSGFNFIFVDNRVTSAELRRSTAIN